MEGFDPRIRDWFAERYGRPTDVQARAWPRIRAGRHVLATAPTGSGKTLTAFLWALDRLGTGAWPGEGVRVLYVSPLKALNNDVRRNLLQPLRELNERCDFPEIAVQVRSGDTPQSERRRMLRRPPEILVTTPESLNLLLSSRGGRRILGGVRTVILDEIHAVAGNKRGSYLMTAVERLTELSGEIQRVALSATVEPLQTVAEFVGGAGRDVEVLASRDEKRVEMSVHAPEGVPEWPALVAEFKEILRTNRSTLFFVNRRALAEQLVRWLNEGEAEPVAYAHHGSLSRELRAFVERRLKEGGLKALVATGSLELGIDIGDLDEVVLVQAPRTLNSAVQRVGRAGHGVGETSRGRIYPTFARDFLDAAVLAPLIEAREVEAVHPVRNPLDVLAQVVVAMCCVEERDLDGVFALLKRSWPFRDLPRAAFDRVIAMLRGRYADSHIRELRPRLRIDPESGRARGADGVQRLVWQSGGVIPDRGYYAMRAGGARIGELDEEFVWERRPGHEFSFGAQAWRIERITRNDVEVVPSAKRGVMPPFWRAERQDRGFPLCERVGLFVESARDRLDDPAFRAELTARHRLDEGAADALLDLLRRQKETAGLPHRHQVIVEHFRDPENRTGNKQVVLHAPWGGKVLKPFAIALAAAWEERYGLRLETNNDDDCVLMDLPHELDAGALFGLVTADNLEPLLRRGLEQTGFFAARFRENAARALLLPRLRAGARTPLWLNRLRATKLLEATGRYTDFPVIAETWRTCLEDEFDVARLRALLDEVATGAIRVREVRTYDASPFARSVVWQGTNLYMYQGDAPARRASSLGEQVLQEVLHDASLRPRLQPELVASLEGKLQRTAPGYVPGDPAEWVDHVEERLLVAPWTEDELPPGLERRGRWVVFSAQHERLERARDDDAALAECVAQFLAGRGPMTCAEVAAWWEVPVPRMQRVLEGLVDDDRVLQDRFRAGAAEEEFCDRENLERLLRMARAAARPAFTALPKERLPLFLAAWQGLVRQGDGSDGLRRCLEQLFGFPAAASLWEEAIFPARLAGYDTAWLDALMQESDLLWFGAGRERAGFCFPEDARLFLPPPGELPDFCRRGRQDFFELAERSGLDSGELTRRLWELAWDGALVNDTYAALRKGIENGFRPVAARPRRRGLARWQSSRPLVGTWRPLAREPAGDPLAEAEDDKERARQLLARYGVVFRELCAAELPALRWGRVVKALRLLELSGEALAGRFFEGFDGLQFATPEALRVLRKEPQGDAVFWLNACDPASACGVVDGLPPRVASTWLVYHGARLALVAKRGGRDLEFSEDPDERRLAVLRTMLTRAFRPRKSIVVEQVKGANPEALRAFGFEQDMNKLVLPRTY